MADRLRNARSPYLRQHADNPVDWYEWGPEAFEAARRDQKPIFLSVGYSSCHWCHVMAHESFDDAAIADLLNREFVSIKVDREERPDVDDAYMTAVQLATGRGGWPMTVFMTPEGHPFFAGTYFPPEDRGEYPGFATLLLRVVEAWNTNRPELVASAERFAATLEEAMSRELQPWPEFQASPALAHLVEALHQEFDPDFGGFGDRPKFPPHTAIRFLLRFLRSENRHEVETILPGAQAMSQEMIRTTLDRILLGGIHDHVGGGFHRYSTDRRWMLPHFEKSLYDNAQLLENLALASHQGDARAGEAARDLQDWLGREMSDPRGFFFSGLDADSEDEEGRFYLWSLAEVREAIGIDPEFERAFHLQPDGNYDDEATGRKTGLNVLYRSDWNGDFRSQLSRLRERRRTRERPSIDDKAIAAWNGMTIVALCEAGNVDRALRCGEAWLGLPVLPHQVVQGEPSGLPFLDDIAHMALAYQRLFVETGDPKWSREAHSLAERLGDYADPTGVYWYTSEDHEKLIGRSRPALDQQMPSGNAAAIRFLTAIGDRERASTTLRRLSGWMERLPFATESLYDALLDLLRVPGDIEVRARLLRRSDTEGVLVLDVPAGWFLGSAADAETSLEATGSPITIEWPPSLEGRVEVPFHVSAPETLTGFRLRYHACNDTQCLAPREIDLPWPPPD